MTEGRVACLSTIHFLHHSQTCGRPWVLITVVWVPYIFTSFSNGGLCAWFSGIVWVPYIFTSFSNASRAVSELSDVWVPYIFTSFSNYAWPCNRVPSVWVPYIFTSFSNNRLFLWDPGEFEYHTFLHHSQTRSKHERNAGGLSTIHFYIILKRLSGVQGFWKVWVPYIFTSFSNYFHSSMTNGYVWVPYIFTSFSN